ncbi:hypothetical protein TNCV_3333831 [Trichonephila clavipes]|nr:hypothetical protein TNCV_3333831 [Trichonephila clavipes]
MLIRQNAVARVPSMTQYSRCDLQQANMAIWIEEVCGMTPPKQFLPTLLFFQVQESLTPWSIFPHNLQRAYAHARRVPRTGCLAEKPAESTRDGQVQTVWGNCKGHPTQLIATRYSCRFTFDKSFAPKKKEKKE